MHGQSLWRSVDLDDVAVGIEQKKLRETGGAVAPDHNAHRVVLRRIFAKAIRGQSSEDAVEIIGAESEMAIGAVDVAGSEGAGRIEGQIALSARLSKTPAPGSPAAPCRCDREAKQPLIKGRATAEDR